MQPGFAAGKVKRNWQPAEIRLQMYLGRKPTARTAERLAVLAPFAPAAETWARTTVESNI